MNIILTGLRGSGKTTIGKLLSEALNMGFMDTDIFIEKKTGMKISALINTAGKEKFRKIESGIIKGTAAIRNCVISTGGGVVENNINMALLKKEGFVIYLKTSPKVLIKRITNAKTRPLLTGADNMLDDLISLEKKREQFYKKYADYIILTDKLNTEEIINLIVGNTL